jgi:CRP-like cAMP-binding protein
VAAMAGIARENVNRILKEWAAQGLISRLAGYYCLEKKHELEKQITL